MARLTGFVEIGYKHFEGTCVGQWDANANRRRKPFHTSFWQFVTLSDGKQVGTQYPTREMLLSDLERYCSEFGATRS